MTKSYSSLCSTLFFLIGIASVIAADASIQVPAPGTGQPKGGYTFSWSVCDTCSSPESAYYDSQSKFIFVSNMAGAPDQKDGNGWIQKLTAGGKVVATKWVTGLDAPKGLRSFKGTLWVSDIDQLVAIDIASGRIRKKYPVAGSRFLNDVAVDSHGTVYVAEMLDNKIFQLKDEKVSIFKEGLDLESPNGLLVDGDDLIVASWGAPAADFSTKIPGKLYKISLSSKEKSLITKEPFGNLDGLEIDASGNYLVSDWRAGKVFRISKSGEATELFSGMNGAADIGFNKGTQMLIIPRMGDAQITAYDLKRYPKNAE